MPGCDTVEKLVKRNATIAVTGLVYAAPTVAILISQLGKPDCSYFSIVMTIGLVSIPQGWEPVKEMAWVKMSIGINKIEDIAANLFLFLIKFVIVLALSALISPFIFIKNLVEFITNCVEIRKIRNQCRPEEQNEKKQ